MRGYSDVSNPSPNPDRRANLLSIYRFIETYIARQHYPPTIFEISQALGLRYDATRQRLLEMERLGWITRDGRKRSIVLKGMGNDLHRL